MMYLCALIGFAFGVIATIISYRINKTIGTLYIDTSSPEKDIYKIEIDDLDVLPKKKIIALKVNTDSNFSQE